IPPRPVVEPTTRGRLGVEPVASSQRDELRGREREPHARVRRALRLGIGHPLLDGEAGDTERRWQCQPVEVAVDLARELLVSVLNEPETTTAQHGAPDRAERRDALHRSSPFAFRPIQRAARNAPGTETTAYTASATAITRSTAPRLLPLRPARPSARGTGWPSPPRRPARHSRPRGGWRAR